MIPRYATPSMSALWSEEARWKAALQVELAVLEAQVATGEVPADAVAVIRAKAKVDVARINELERTTDHDVVAFVNQLAESVGPEGRWIHHGLTSSDVVDTALALQMREAAALIDSGLNALLATIVRRAREERDTIMIGRTHGIHAEPTTMGAKMANWAFEVSRARRRIADAAAEAATGKISGPVGTYSQISPEVEQIALTALGLRADQASTQIVQRDRHAAFVASIAIAGGTLERIATEIRHLQRTEVDEMREPFRAGQAGSSAMPQKRNPIKSERIAGLARLLRGYAAAAMENQPLWHERDISHSSAERILLPDATSLLAFMVESLTAVIDSAEIRRERMRQNLDAGLGLYAASRLLIALVDKGAQRDGAYAIVQNAASRAREANRHLLDVCQAMPEITAELSRTELLSLFDPGASIAGAALLVDRLDQLEVGN
ncbi:MAG: adenylosuccinate lyase [bacterium]|nr:adenylosuccinate lyase [Candidatus Aquidulcis sp.]